MGITVIYWLIGHHLSNWQGKCVYTVKPLLILLPPLTSDNLP